MSNQVKFDNVQILSVVNNPIEQIPKGIQMLGVPLEWKETRGQGIKIAVLDTGRPNHPDIKVKESFVSTGLINATPGDVFDRDGHSTHVCGTICANGKILGVLPEAELYTAKVLGDTGSGSDNTIAQGMRWAIDRGVDVINLSLGGQNPQLQTHQLIKEAVGKGIIVVCAAGNAGEVWMGYPAKFPETIAVAAIDMNKNRPDFSSVGEEVEVCALGTEVFSTWLNGQYATLKGTSMACPHITGAVGILIAKTKIRYGRKPTLNEIRYALHLYAEDLGERGKDKFHGYGVFSFGRFEVHEKIPPSESVNIKMWIDKDEYIINGQKIKHVAPILHNATTMIPVRIVSERMGLGVLWNGTERSVTITGKKYNY